ncbi:hypothetical protein F2Q68_00023989 [Brassica cretica]|uniref:Uncharacterized protein n=1 Tax=Brassica cretica TaxID=69181 RepID=A0A8S9IAA7_BRACR|nr:hypothetical protein F2Q68_00023989 [Brassica cretica]
MEAEGRRVSQLKQKQDIKSKTSEEEVAAYELHRSYGEGDSPISFLTASRRRCNTAKTSCRWRLLAIERNTGETWLSFHQIRLSNRTSKSSSHHLCVLTISSRKEREEVKLVGPQGGGCEKMGQTQSQPNKLYMHNKGKTLVFLFTLSCRLN